LNPKWIRLIGGFGRIHWVTADRYWAQNSPVENAEEVIIDDLNRSQSQHLLQACIRHFGKSTMVSRFQGVDCDGFDLLVNDDSQQFYCASPIYSSDGFRTSITEWLNEQQ